MNLLHADMAASETATPPARRSDRVGQVAAAEPRRVTADPASIRRCGIAAAAECTAARPPVRARQKVWNALEERAGSTENDPPKRLREIGSIAGSSGSSA